MAEVDYLDGIGIDAVVGMALYTGRLDGADGGDGGTTGRDENLWTGKTPHRTLRQSSPSKRTS